jgi:hypothetical protein
MPTPTHFDNKGLSPYPTVLMTPDAMPMNGDAKLPDIVTNQAKPRFNSNFKQH